MNHPRDCDLCQELPARLRMTQDGIRLLVCVECFTAQTETIIGKCEGRTYVQRPGNGYSGEVWSIGPDGQHFVCTGSEWPHSAVSRRMR